MSSCAFAKVILVVSNALFFLLGAASLSLGIWTAVSKNSLFKAINLLDGKISSGSNKEQIDGAANRTGFVLMAAYILIGVGAFTLIVGFCGCCGAIKESRCLLCIYSTLVGLILIIQIVAAVLVGVFQGRIRGKAEDALLSLQDKYFVSMPTYLKNRNLASGTDAAKATVTNLLNIVQVTFECCGAKKVNDISGSSSWLASDRTWSSYGTLLKPMTCCKLKDSNAKSQVTSPAFKWENFYGLLQDQNCPFQKDTPKQMTCLDGLMKFLRKFSIPLIGICGGIALFEILGIVLSICLICSLRNHGNAKGAVHITIK